jgi:hypothetical protein
MKTQKSFYKSSIIFAAVFSLFLLSCSDSTNPSGGNQNPVPIDTSTFTYPMNIGNTWNYSRVYNIFNIRPDSILHLFTGLPLHGTGTVEIVYDTLINGIMTRCFVDTYTENNRVFVSRMYYLNTDSALFVIAYRLSSSSTIFPKGSRKVFFKYNGIVTDDLHHMLNSIQYFGSYAESDTLIIENPPVRSFVYPVTKNREWIYRYFFTDTIYKKYHDFENLSIGNVNISCMKTQLYWSSIDFDYYDHYSRSGKLKSDFLGEDMIVTNEYGQTLGYVDVSDIYNVTSFHIADP